MVMERRQFLFVSDHGNRTIAVFAVLFFRLCSPYEAAVVSSVSLLAGRWCLPSRCSLRVVPSAALLSMTTTFQTSFSTARNCLYCCTLCRIRRGYLAPRDQYADSRHSSDRYAVISILLDLHRHSALVVAGRERNPDVWDRYFTTERKVTLSSVRTSEVRSGGSWRERWVLSRRYVRGSVGLWLRPWPKRLSCLSLCSVHCMPDGSKAYKCCTWHKASLDEHFSFEISSFPYFQRFSFW